MAEETEYDLVVEDANLEEFNTEIDSLVTEIEETISAYLKVMHQVLDSGLKEGKVHNNLEYFVAIAGPLNYNLTMIKEAYINCNSSFITDMDAADDFLF